MEAIKGQGVWVVLVAIRLSVVQLASHKANKFLELATLPLASLLEFILQGATTIVEVYVQIARGHM